MKMGEIIRVDNEDFDNFPTGMRVLAVDDDVVCLKLLETILIKCKYHVTVTSHARTALNMLRENKDRFDLVISDVRMPDMDGFKLLELVSLEMDLPVIMLSENSDAKLVMKGVNHGACDYLVKPVRYEELKNIWQHVIRRKKSCSRKQINQTVDQGKASGEANGSLTTGDEDNQNGKNNRKRKRKDDVEDESEDNDNGNDSDDPATQKKPRLIWSSDLRAKFVAAVRQLGLDKAGPKKILALMNVEGLSRANVGSYLQKYRNSLNKLQQTASSSSQISSSFQVTPSSNDATINNTRFFNSANAFMDGSSNLLNGTQNNSLMLHGNNLRFGDPSSHSSTSLLDFDTIELPELQQYSTEPFKNTARENNFPNGHYLANNSRENMQIFNQGPNERWGEHVSSSSNNTNIMFGPLNNRSTYIPGNNGIIVSPLNRNNIGNFNQKMDMILNGRWTPMQQQNDNGNLVIDSNSFAPQSCDLLDDLMNNDLTPVEFIDDFLFGQDV